MTPTSRSLSGSSEPPRNLCMAPPSEDPRQPSLGIAVQGRHGAPIDGAGRRFAAGARLHGLSVRDVVRRACGAEIPEALVHGPQTRAEVAMRRRESAIVTVVVRPDRGVVVARRLIDEFGRSI